jgi:hypothetical protein
MFGTTVVDRYGHEKVLRIDVKIPEKFLVRCYAAVENDFSSGAERPPQTKSSNSRRIRIN